MTDCPNAQMRDRLPDLLHEQLDASARAAVVAHVAGCAECRTDLALLRQMHVSLSAVVVAVDSAGIARAVVTRTIVQGRRGRWSEWRLAAAIAVIVVGGGAVAALHVWHTPNELPPSVASQVAEQPSPGEATEGTPAVEGVSTHAHPARETARADAREQLAAAGDVSDLSESELQTLLGDLDTLEAIPPTEPEPVTVRVSLPDQGGSE